MPLFFLTAIPLERKPEAATPAGTEPAFREAGARLAGRVPGWAKHSPFLCVMSLEPQTLGSLYLRCGVMVTAIIRPAQTPQPSHIADLHHPDGHHGQRFLFERGGGGGEVATMQKTLPDTHYWRVLLLLGRWQRKGTDIQGRLQKQATQELGLCVFLARTTACVPPRASLS